MKQAATTSNSKTRFRPQRFPAVRLIVEGEASVPSLVDKVVDTIVSKIVQKELSSGTRLKSTQLAKELGVSRTPVSTAMAKLSADGILLQRNNFQATVAEGASEWLIQIHKLRELIEPEAAAMAAGQFSEDVLDDLWMLCRDAKPTPANDWTAAAEYFDFALHLAIAEFCGNLALKSTIRKCWSYKRLSYMISDGCKSALKPEYLQHVAILNALADGDSELARQQMSIHLQTATASRFSERIV